MNLEILANGTVKRFDLDNYDDDAERLLEDCNRFARKQRTSVWEVHSLGIDYCTILSEFEGSPLSKQEAETLIEFAGLDLAELQAALAHYLVHGKIHEASKPSTIAGSFDTGCESLEELGRMLFSERGMTAPNDNECYVNYEAIGRDAHLNGNYYWVSEMGSWWHLAR